MVIYGGADHHTVILVWLTSTRTECLFRLPHYNSVACLRKAAELKQQHPPPRSKGQWLMAAPGLTWGPFISGINRPVCADLPQCCRRQWAVPKRETAVTSLVPAVGAGRGYCRTGKGFHLIRGVGGGGYLRSPHCLDDTETCSQSSYTPLINLAAMKQEEQNWEGLGHDYNNIWGPKWTLN